MAQPVPHPQPAEKVHMEQPIILGTQALFIGEMIDVRDRIERFLNDEAIDRSDWFLDKDSITMHTSPVHNSRPHCYMSVTLQGPD